jgi:hypothetical protein
VHEILRTSKTESGRIEWFPAHPHEGALHTPAGDPWAVPVVRGTSARSGRPFELAVCIDGEPDDDGRALGRVVACSTFHHFADMNWDPAADAPTFVTEPRSDEISRDPARLAVFMDYVHNIARWLSGAEHSISPSGLTPVQRELLQELIDERFPFDCNVMALDAHTWVLHGSIPVDGHVILAEYRTEAEAEAALRILHAAEQARTSNV